jgi:hypothetical protein
VRLLGGGSCCGFFGAVGRRLMWVSIVVGLVVHDLWVSIVVGLVVHDLWVSVALQALTTSTNQRDCVHR